MRETDRRAEDIARRQHGFISRDQCRAAGLTDRQIQVRLQSHGWRRHLPGIFLLPAARPSREGHLWAVQLWAGSGSILGYSSAAYLHRIDDGNPAEPHVYLRSGRSCKGVVVHRLNENDHPETCRIRGLVATRVERTLLDLSSCWPAVRVGGAMDAALRQRLTSLARLADEPSRSPSKGRSGTQVYRRLVRGRDHRDPLLRSDFEGRMLRVVRRIDKAHAVPNHLVVDGTRRYRVDFAFVQHRLAIECQSIRWHLGEEAYKRDMARHRRLLLLGWQVLFYPWDDVVFRPQEVEAEIRDALAARENVLL